MRSASPSSSLIPSVLLSLLVAACGSSSSDGGSAAADGGGPGSPAASGDAGAPPLFSPDASPAPPGGDGGSPLPPGMIMATVRDFAFYDGTATTNPDFENPPYDIDGNGNASNGYVGPWDDHGIVEPALGADGAPVYAHAGGKTLTTHGQAAFDAWFHDTAGMNKTVTFPLPLAMTTSSSGAAQYGYDSEVSGVLYTPGDPSSGKGFFPVDDGTPYGKPAADTFGNQALTSPPYATKYPDPQSSNHNFSFTFELHTVFTYAGGESFDFRGDDDVFVFIDKKQVIDLGGIHGAESATVNVDSLGLTKGQTYPLDFFSVERHVVGSNIRFTTTLALRPPIK